MKSAVCTPYLLALYGRVLYVMLTVICPVVVASDGQVQPAYVNHTLRMNVSVNLVQVAEGPGGQTMGYILGKAEGEGEQWHGHVTAVTVSMLQNSLTTSHVLSCCPVCV